MDLLIGAVINRVLATGKPTTRDVARQAAEIIIAGLRNPPTGRQRP